MKPIGIHQIVEIVSGTFISERPGSDVSVASILTDSRQLQPGALFVAIRGENHNGMNFLADAAAKGSVAAIVEERPSAPPANLPLILVPNARKALGELGRFTRRQ